MPDPKKKSTLLQSFEDWFNQDGVLQRLVKSQDPTTEPLLPEIKSATEHEPDTWMGGFTKGLKDEAKGAYSSFVRPFSSITGLAALTGQEEALPAGMSKAQFANWLKSHPHLMASLTKLGSDAVGELRLPVKGAISGLEKGAAESAVSEELNIAKRVRDLTVKNQGATYHLEKGDLANSKEPLFAVSTFPERSQSFPNSPKSSQLEQYIQDNADLLKDPENSLGTWWDKEAKQFTLDVVKTIPSKEDALALGKKFNQKAIFDLHKMEEIPVPGPPTPTKAPLPSDARIDELLKKFGGTQPESRVQPLTDQQTAQAERMYQQANPVFKQLQGQGVFQGDRTTLPPEVEQKVEEMLQLEHRSPQEGLTTIDPEFYGTLFAGEEKKRASDPNFLKRSFFNVKGTTPEKRFEKMPVYEGEVPSKTIYSITDDPKGFIPQAQKLGQGDNNVARTLFEMLLYKDGFKGYSDGKTVVYFDVLPVRRKKVA